MKKQCLAACFAAFFSCAAYAQDNSSNPDTSVYAPIQPSGPFAKPLPDNASFPKPLPDNAVTPSFPGGNQGIMQFLGSHIIYPEQAKKNNNQGVVALSFVVEKDGSVSNVTILHDIGGGCGAEAVRVVKLMPKWTPGMVDGAAVRVRYTLPVRFKLDEPEKPKKKKLSQRDSLFGN